MDNVKIEITAKGWEIVANVDGKEYRQKAVMKSVGSATHEVDDIEDDSDLPEELYDALNSFFCFDVAGALWDLSDADYEKEDED